MDAFAFDRRLMLKASLAVSAALLMACGSEPASPPPDAQQAPTAATPEPAADPLLTQFISKPFHVNQKWKSMEGPSHQTPVVISQSRGLEYLWFRGYRTEIIPADGDGTVSQEFMCHNNLDFIMKPPFHSEIFGWGREKAAFQSPRLFTLSQGQFEVTLPEGFGLPLRSDEGIFLTTQVLNHNIENADISVRHRVEIDVVRDEDLEEPLKPLYASAVTIMASLGDTDAYYAVKDPDAVHQGSSCEVGTTPDTIKEHVYTDELGQRFTGHWVLKPGREIRHTLVTKRLNVTSDTRIHFIGAHLHPFAESLALRDLTTGETLYTIEATGPETGIGLEHVTFYSSTEGIAVYRDHEYELVSIYNNTSGVDQDAMAVLFLYLYDEDAARAIKYARQLKIWAKESS